MYKSMLKAGATALAGYAVKKFLHGEDPNTMLKKYLTEFKNIVKIDIDDVLDAAEECFDENYPSGDFDEQYEGSFENRLEAAKYLLVTSLDSFSWLEGYEGENLDYVLQDADSVAEAYLDHMLNDGTVAFFDDENGFCHVFNEEN